jgi:hypothetical protein
MFSSRFSSRFLGGISGRIFRGIIGGKFPENIPLKKGGGCFPDFKNKVPVPSKICLCPKLERRMRREYSPCSIGAVCPAANAELHDRANSALHYQPKREGGGFPQTKMNFALPAKFSQRAGGAWVNPVFGIRYPVFGI